MEIIMQKKQTTEKSWDHFWSLDQTQQFKNESWSKRRVKKILTPFLKTGGWALDAGCGSGFFSAFFCRQNMNVVSLDYSVEALEMAKKMTQGRTQALKEDLLDPKLPQRLTQRFDLIFSDGLFEHFSSTDQDIIMQNLKNLLSENGVIVTFVPNLWSPWQLLRPFMMPGIYEKPFMLSGLSALHMRHDLKLQKKGGLNVLPIGLSPDALCGSLFGMLLYCVASKK